VSATSDISQSRDPTGRFMRRSSMVRLSQPWTADSPSDESRERCTRLLFSAHFIGARRWSVLPVGGVAVISRHTFPQT
jgi:hypothetical protein